MQTVDLLNGLEATLAFDWANKNSPQVIFVGTVFFPIFLARWRELFTRAHGTKFLLYNEESLNINSLSNRNCFMPAQKLNLWLGSIAEVSAPEKLKNLQAVNLSFFCEEAKLEKISSIFHLENFLVIKIPKSITPKLLLKIMELLEIRLNPARLQLLQDWAENFATISLDLALQICNYIQLLNPSQKMELALLSQECLTGEQKFFQLPELLFSGNWPKFFALWTQVKENFQLPFWTTFWLNALYKAAAVKAGIASAAFGKSLARSANSTHFQGIPIDVLKLAIFEIYKLDHDFKQGLATGNIEPILLSLC